MAKTKKALSSVGDIIGHIEKKVVRKRILDEGTRIDGRDTKTVRPHRNPARHPAPRPRLRAVHAR